MLLLVCARWWGDFEKPCHRQRIGAEKRTIKNNHSAIVWPGFNFVWRLLVPSAHFLCNEVPMLFVVLVPQCAVAVHEGRNNGTGNYTGSPCALVSQSSRAAVAAEFYWREKCNPLLDLGWSVRKGIPTIDAQLAYNCLKSVPLNAAAAIDLVTSILLYLKWQSDDLDPESGLPARNVAGKAVVLMTPLRGKSTLSYCLPKMRTKNEDDGKSKVSQEK